MNNTFSIITNVEFFKYELEKRQKAVHVAPRKFSSLTFRIRGKISIFATNTEIISTANTLTFVPHGFAYDTEVFEDGEMYVLHFWEAEGSTPFGEKPQSVEVPFTDTFINLFVRALRHTQNEQAPYASLADAYRLLAEAQSLFFKNQHAPTKRMIVCKQYLDEHICNPELRVSELAEKHGCSEVYFRTEFRKCYGCLPIEYIKKRRLEIACRLLQTNLYSVTEVATRSGFDSISYFSAQFRRAMGCSPREYQMQ